MNDATQDALLMDKQVNLFFDMSTNLLFKQDDQNFINSLSAKQLPILKTSLREIYLSEGHSVETHWHPNTTELLYCIKGGALVTVFNPFTLKLIRQEITSGQTFTLPQGWWHWVSATSDQVNLLSVFDHPNPVTVYGSDILRETPAAVFQQLYGLNEEELENALKSITETIIIAPPVSE